jgi:hypothetical protein
MYVIDTKQYNGLQFILDEKDYLKEIKIDSDKTDLKISDFKEHSVIQGVRIFDCGDFGNKQNSLYGKIFQLIYDDTAFRITDVPELEHWNYLGGWSIGDRFGVEYFKDDNEDIVCVFEEYVQRDENGKSKRKILDTINIGKLKSNESFQYGTCRLNKTGDREIIAIVIVEGNKEFFNKIMKAWRADTKTGRIKQIDIKGIDCENDGYGV